MACRCSCFELGLPVVKVDCYCRVNLYARCVVREKFSTRVKAILRANLSALYYVYVFTQQWELATYRYVFFADVLRTYDCYATVEID